VSVSSTPATLFAEQSTYNLETTSEAKNSKITSFYLEMLNPDEKHFSISVPTLPKEMDTTLTVLFCSPCSCLC
jgi:hypothetical protein